MKQKQYNVRFEFCRSVLISPDGSSYLINSNTDNEFMYCFANMNLFCQLYDGYLPFFMMYSFDFFIHSYIVCLSLP